MDHKLLDTTQVVSGLAVLLSFYVGYKYGLKCSEKQEDSPDTSDDESSTKEPHQDFDSGEMKMVLIVRNDLNMGKGKIGAQCGHAAVGAYETAKINCPKALRRWNRSGSAKIVLKTQSLDELMALKREAQRRHLNTYVITDAGRTQIEPNTKTVLAIGPANKNAIDEVAGHLKLM